MNNKRTYSKYTVKDNNRLYYVNGGYIPNTRTLLVYYNGFLLTSGDDYSEQDEYHVRLLFEPYNNDFILIYPSCDMKDTSLINHDHNEYDLVVVTRNEQVVHLKQHYIPNQQMLKVYCNGMLVDPFSYTEIDSTTIKLGKTFVLGDEVVISSVAKTNTALHMLPSRTIKQSGTVKNVQYEFFKVVSNERDFTLKMTYEPHTRALTVYLNGNALTESVHYVEVDNHTIHLMVTTEKDDIVTVVPVFDPSIHIGRIDGDLIGHHEGALYYRYTSSKQLMYNQKYTLSIKTGEEDYNYTFTSQYSPFYTSSKIIRNDLGDAISHLEDDAIHFTIWQNSKEAEERFGDYLETKLSSIKSWVRYKTSYDLINMLFLDRSVRLGSHQKILGAMQVNKTINAPQLESMLLVIERKLKAEETKIIGAFVTTGRATRKAGNTDYPITTERRSF